MYFSANNTITFRRKGVLLMNIKHAQYMLTVMQEGSITAAAKKLYISQPSLSQMIKLVETNLGTPIFNRSTDPITLTYAGEKYIEAAKQILTINNNLQKEIDEINHEDHGCLKLGIPVQRAMQVLPYVLPRFMKKYPFVDHSICMNMVRPSRNAMLIEGSIDLACITTYPKHEELSYTLIEDEDLVLLTSRNTDLARRNSRPEPPLRSRRPGMKNLFPAKRGTMSASSRNSFLPLMICSRIFF